MNTLGDPRKGGSDNDQDVNDLRESGNHKRDKDEANTTDSSNFDEPGSSSDSKRNKTLKEYYAKVKVTHKDYDPKKDHPIPPGLSSTAIGSCSINYRYVENNGWLGALKYDPVSDAKAFKGPAAGVLQHIRDKRCGRYVRLKFKIVIHPGCTDFKHKIMAVPSVDCPSLLTNENFLRNLLWVAKASERPTFLVVHTSEVKCYQDNIGKILERLKVGLVSWECKEPVLGFGVSRLAAQQFAYILGENPKVILCDVGVIDRAKTLEMNRKIDEKKVLYGYSTDEENKRKYAEKFKSPYYYMGIGPGKGNPAYLYTTSTTKNAADKNGLKKLNKPDAGPGRPIEQLVIVNNKTLYDPCFITSSEDMDLSQQIVYLENYMRGKDQLHYKSFKGGFNIDKMETGKFEKDKKEMPGQSLSMSAYRTERNKYLKTLVHENDLTIHLRYSSESKEEDYVRNLEKHLAKEGLTRADNVNAPDDKMIEIPITVGKLAKIIKNMIRSESEDKEVEIRSLIIEKVLLSFKYNTMEDTYPNISKDKDNKGKKGKKPNSKEKAALKPIIVPEYTTKIKKNPNYFPYNTTSTSASSSTTTTSTSSTFTGPSDSTSTTTTSTGSD